jgi:hypothetical protein
MNDIHETNAGQNGPATWIESLLSEARLPADFDVRSKTAGQAAYSIDRMRRERRHNKFSELPFHRHIRGLAEFAGASLAPIQQTFGIESWQRITAQAAPLVARVARLIGLTLAETDLSVRWAFFDSMNPERSEEILALSRGDSEPIPVGTTLAAEEAGYSGEEKAELERIARAIRGEYAREL